MVAEDPAETLESPVRDDSQQQHQQGQQQEPAECCHRDGSPGISAVASEGVAMPTLPRALSPVEEESEAVELENPMVEDAVSAGEDSSRSQYSLASVGDSQRRWEGEEDEECGGMFADADVVARLAAAAAAAQDDAFDRVSRGRGVDTAGARKCGSEPLSSSPSRWSWNQSGDSWVHHQAPSPFYEEKPALSVKRGQQTSAVTAATDGDDSTAPSPSATSSAEWTDFTKERFDSGLTDPEVQGWLSVFAAESRGEGNKGQYRLRLAMEEKSEELEKLPGLQETSTESGKKEATVVNPPPLVRARVPPHSPLRVVDGSSPRVVEDAEFLAEASPPSVRELGAVSEPECEIPEPATLGPRSGSGKTEVFSWQPIHFARDMRTEIVAKDKEKQVGLEVVCRSPGSISSIGAVGSRGVPESQGMAAVPITGAGFSSGVKSAAKAHAQRGANLTPSSEARERTEKKHVTAGPENLEATIHLPPKAHGGVQRRVLLTPRAGGGGGGGSSRGFSAANTLDRLPDVISAHTFDVQSKSSWLAPVSSPDSSRPLRVSEVIQAFERLSPRRKNLTPRGLTTPTWSTPVATPDRSFLKTSKPVAPGERPRRAVRATTSAERSQVASSKPHEEMYKWVARSVGAEERFESVISSPPQKASQGVLAVVSGGGVWSTPVATPDRLPSIASEVDSDCGTRLATPERTAAAAFNRSGDENFGYGLELFGAPTTWKITTSLTLPPTDTDTDVGRDGLYSRSFPGVDRLSSPRDGKDRRAITTPESGTGVTIPAPSGAVDTTSASVNLPTFLSASSVDRTSLQGLNKGTDASLVVSKAEMIRPLSKQAARSPQPTSPIVAGVHGTYRVRRGVKDPLGSHPGPLSNEIEAWATEAYGKSRVNEVETKARQGANNTAAVKRAAVGVIPGALKGATDATTATGAMMAKEGKSKPGANKMLASQQRRRMAGRLAYERRVASFKDASEGTDDHRDTLGMRFDQTSVRTSPTSTENFEGPLEAQAGHNPPAVSTGREETTVPGKTSNSGETNDIVAALEGASREKKEVIEVPKGGNEKGTAKPVVKTTGGGGQRETDPSSEAAAVAALVAEAMALADVDEDRFAGDGDSASTGPGDVSRQRRTIPKRSIRDLVAAEGNFASSRSLLSWSEGEPIEDGDAERDAEEVQALVAEALALLRETEVDDDVEDA